MLVSGRHTDIQESSEEENIFADKKSRHSSEVCSKIFNCTEKFKNALVFNTPGYFSKEIHFANIDFTEKINIFSTEIREQNQKIRSFLENIFNFDSETKWRKKIKLNFYNHKGNLFGSKKRYNISFYHNHAKNKELQKNKDKKTPINPYQLYRFNDFIEFKFCNLKKELPKKRRKSNYKFPFRRVSPFYEADVQLNEFSNVAQKLIHKIYSNARVFFYGYFIFRKRKPSKLSNFSNIIALEFLIINFKKLGEIKTPKNTPDRNKMRENKSLNEFVELFNEISLFFNGVWRTLNIFSI